MRSSSQNAEAVDERSMCIEQVDASDCNLSCSLSGVCVCVCGKVPALG